MELPARKYFMNFCEKVPKKCVLAAYHMKGVFQKGRSRQRRQKIVKRFVNFFKRPSKKCVLVAYALRELFSLRCRSKHKILSD